MFLSRFTKAIPRKTNKQLFSTLPVKAHSTFLTDVAKFTVPTRINSLIELLVLRGEELVNPYDRAGINPFLIPLTYNAQEKSYTCYIRWPTQRSEMDLQIVQTNEVGVRLISLNTDQYCHRLLVENEFQGHTNRNHMIEKVNADGMLYKSGDYQGLINSGKFPTNTPEELALIIDRYILTKIGQFPDCYERLSLDFLTKQKETSSLVTCERAISLFYGWGHPMNFHTKLITQLGRHHEAKESAKSSMGMPKWTLASTFQELEIAVQTAGFTNIKIVGDMHKFRANDPRTKDIEEEGLNPIQVPLDQAAHLMDAVALRSIDGGWDAIRNDLAARYRAGGYPDMATFIDCVKQ